MFFKQFQAMNRVSFIIMLVLAPAILASQRSREEGTELREKDRERHTKVRVVRSSDERLSVVNVKAKNRGDDEDDADDDDDDEDSNENEENQRNKVEASGDDDKSAKSEDDDDDDDDNDDGNDDEGQDNAQKVVCKRRCTPPMTFDQCANPRCAMKHSIVKELCYYLCKHQQIRCRETCEPEWVDGHFCIRNI